MPQKDVCRLGVQLIVKRTLSAGLTALREDVRVLRHISQSPYEGQVTTRGEAQCTSPAYSHIPKSPGALGGGGQGLGFTCQETEEQRADMASPELPRHGCQHRDKDPSFRNGSDPVLCSGRTPGCDEWLCQLRLSWL